MRGSKRGRHALCIGLIAVLASLSMATVAAGQQDPLTELRTGPLDLVEIARGIYVVDAHLAGARATVIVSDDGVTIVDSHSTPATASGVVEALTELTDAPIRYVVNTHWHVDHHSGNRAYYEAFPEGVEFIAHHATREDIPTLGVGQLRDMLGFFNLDQAEERLESGLDEHGNPLSLRQRQQIETFIEEQRDYLARAQREDFRFEPLPTLTLSQKLVLHTDAREIHILYFYKAHTRGDVVVYLPDEKILVAGDVLTRPILWTWSSYPAEYIKTLDALEELDIDKIVIGHGPLVLEGKDYLRVARAALSTIVDYVAAGLESGSSMERLLESAKSDSGIQVFRGRFISDPEDDALFDSFVEWTVERAYLERTGALK